MRPLLLMALLATGCATTSGERLQVEAVLAGGTTSGSSPTSFTTVAGWEVDLEEARVALGPIYLYDGEPMARLRWPSLVPTAWACGAHAQYSYGETLAEILDQHAVDLLAAELVSVGFLDGLAGTIRSAEVHLHPPGEVSSSSGFELLDGETLQLRGVASQGEVEVPFAVGLTVPDEATMRIVESVRVDEVELVADQPGALQVEVLVDRWLASVDFGSLTVEEEGVYAFDEDSQAWSALLMGVRSREAYAVTWREP